MKSNSSKPAGHQNLAKMKYTSRRSAEKLLMEFANAPDDVKSHEDLLQRHAKDIAPDSLMSWYTMGRFSKLIRKAWDAKDDRSFNWYVWEAMSQLGVVNRWVANADDPPEQVTPLEVALLFMQSESHRALHCPNPGCKHPYFFRKRKNQRFCCFDCAQPTQRESKRRWWNEHKSKKGGTK